MKKSLRRIFALLSASVLCVGASAAFTGCTTNKPEITITYAFNGETYAVDYVLSRSSAPQTVQHFLELANLGYYNGLCIHNYSETYLYAGGYTYNKETKELGEKDYFATVKDWNLTQSVFVGENGDTGMNTVYGEFSDNGVSVTGEKFTHQAGALVMYYTNKGTNCNERVATLRNSDGVKQFNSEYKYNSATSLFYTYTGSSNSARDKSYCVFGKATNYTEQMTNGLLAAISSYIEGLDDEASFTEDKSVYINANDYYESVRNEKIRETFAVPVEPIVIESVKINKY